MKCPRCNGLGELIIPFIHGNKNTIKCFQCDGKGQVAINMNKWIEDGEILKEKRISKRITLRDAAKKLCPEDLSNMVTTLSNMEMGVVKPDMGIYNKL